MADEVARIPLCDRYGVVRAWALVDAVDRPRLEAVGRWSRHGRGYAVYVSRGAGSLLMHHAVLGRSPGGRVEGWKIRHRNGNKLDCRRQNLEVISAPPRVGIPRGVSRDTTYGTWRARLVREGHESVARYATMEAAAVAVERMRAA